MKTIDVMILAMYTNIVELDNFKKGDVYMLNKDLVKMLTDQLNMEFYSAYLYLDISNYFADKNLSGFATWFNIQAQEERDHAMLFNKYLLNNSEPVKLMSIAAPDTAFSSFREPVEAAFEHERKVTESINNIYAAAYPLKDFRTMQFLDWFVKEQGEEEKNVDDILKRYDLFAGEARGLYLLDTELAARVYTPPTLVI